LSSPLHDVWLKWIDSDQAWRNAASGRRAGLCARVSINDQQVLTMQSRATECAARRGLGIAVNVREIGSSAAPERPATRPESTVATACGFLSKKITSLNSWKLRRNCTASSVRFRCRGRSGCSEKPN